MKDKVKNKFNWRALISLFVFFSLIIITVSGVVLYLAPAGRIAKWTHISIIGFEKEQWQAIHTIFGYLFAISIIFHIKFNWKPLVSYFRRKIEKRAVLRKELVVSFAVTLLWFIFTLFNLPPFSLVMDLGETLSDSWAKEQNEPPVPHAEEMTISELAEAVDQTAEVLLSNLKANNVAADKQDVVKDLAKKYNLTPMELFEKMKTVKKAESSVTYSGRGLGRKTLKEVCELESLDLEKSLLLLKNKGIDADAEMTLRDIAEKYNLKPVDIMEIINPEK